LGGILKNKLLWGLAVGAMLAIGGIYWLLDAVPDTGHHDPVRVIIPRGANLSQIAQILHKQGVISSEWSFVWAGRLLGSTRKLPAGEFEFPRPLSNSHTLEILRHAKPVEITITIPEGLRSDEIIHILVGKLELDSLKLTSLLTDSALLALAGEGFTHLEGCLYPDTYKFLRGEDERTVLARMVRNFRRHFKPEWRARARELGLTIPQVVTLASMIEKEAARPEERSLISSVYHNRLRRNMLLNCDPTLIYMLVRRGEWNGNLQRRHKRIRDPYNTYLFRGLPPGPIANPGAASLEAALYPAVTDYLYFVSRNDGTRRHVFARTLRQHINNVNRFQKHPRRWSKTSSQG